MATAGRALTAKGQRQRERIVSAAGGLIAERGIAATTTEDVRTAAGISGSQLYHYFTDKDALINAVVDQRNDLIVGSEEAFWDEVTTASALWAWRDRVIDLVKSLACRGGCPIGGLVPQLSETDDAARLRLAAGLERWRAAMARGFAAMQSAGELQPGADPAGLAAALLAAHQGGLVMTQATRDSSTLALALDTVIQSAVGLRPHRRPRSRRG